MNNQPLFSVILCSRNGETVIEEALQSLLGQSLPPHRFEIIVVDNGSTDRTLPLVTAIADRHPGRLRLVSEPVAGLSRARNRGIRASRAPLIAFFDDDARAGRQWLSHLEAGFDHESIGAVGGPIEPLWKTPPPDWWEPDLDHLQSRLDHGPRRRTIVYPEALYGSNIAVRREVLRRIGLFREQLGRRGKVLLGGAEVELQIRIQQDGWEISYEPGARIHHLSAPRRATREHLRRKAYWYGRSQIRCELIAGARPDKNLLLLPLLIAKSALGVILLKSGRLNRQYHLIYNLGYLVERIALFLRPETAEPPPCLE